MIDPRRVSAILVTKGDHNLSEILASIEQAGIEDVVVWDNSEREDLSCFGRYAGIAEAKHEVIYHQDDDLVAPVEAILAAYDPEADRETIVANNRRAEGWLLTAMGTVFHRNLAGSLERHRAEWPWGDEDFCRVSDVVFAYEHPYRRITFPYRDLPWAATPDRMHLQPDHYVVRERAREHVLSASMPVSVVTPWLNHPELWPDYRQALEMGPLPSEVVIVDNASDPPHPYAAVALGHNAGFSAGSNAGLHAATSEIVLFLNNDVAPERAGWLREIMDLVEPGVLVGPLRFDPHGDVDGQSFPYLDGWCLAGMREDLLSLDGFDESYDEPSYYSDNDLCLRARAAGMTLREVHPGLHHKTGVTTNANGYLLPSTIANRARFEARVRELTVGV